MLYAIALPNLEDILIGLIIAMLILSAVGYIMLGKQHDDQEGSDQ